MTLLRWAAWWLSTVLAPQLQRPGSRPAALLHDRPHATLLNPCPQVMCGNVGHPTATVVLKGPDGVARRAAALGTGPVDAVFKVGGWGWAAGAGGVPVWGEGGGWVPEQQTAAAAAA